MSLSSGSDNNSHPLGPRELVDQLARQQAELQFELDQLSKRAEAFSSKTSFYAALTSGLATAAALVATSNLLPSSQELLFTAFLAVLATLAVSLALTGLWREKRKEVASLEMALEMYRYLAVKLKTELSQGSLVSLVPYLDEKKEADSLIEKGQNLLAKVRRGVKP